MSTQNTLDFGFQLAPTIPRAPVQSANGDVPGEGRFIAKCERCGRVRRRKRPARFCSDACKAAQRHDKQAAIEERKKRRGMRGSAAKNAEYLAIARLAAQVVVARDGDADADRVRLYLEDQGTVLPSGGWWGSLFQADPGHEWTTVGRTKCKHKGGKSREIRVWR